MIRPLLHWLSGSSMSITRASRPSRPARFEALECRLLLSADCPVIELIEGDNRGQIRLQISRGLDGSTVSGQSVQIFTAGNDGLLGTDDDVRAMATVELNNAERSIFINADIDPDERFQIFVDGSIVRGNNGRLIDGEFNGASSHSGDGVEGGDFVAYSRTALTPIARFDTIEGTIDVELFRDATPLTVANFLQYANDAAYDGSFFHRLVAGFVIQGGGFSAQELNGSEFTQEIPSRPPVLNEPGISNLRGTIAMAKLGGNPNSATNQWFFNLGNNSGNLDVQNGGFTVFGRITGPDGLEVVDRLAALDIVNATLQGGAFGELPVTSAEAFESNGNQFTNDLLAIVNRVSLLVDFTDEPFQQLDTDGTIAFQGPDGETAVRLFSLNGGSLGAAEDALNIGFLRNGNISFIRINDSFPTNDVGIQIIGANNIGSIIDGRRDPGDNIAFIVTDGRINSLQLRGSITGYNLNGFVLPGGMILPNDIDGDGTDQDEVAILTAGDFMQSLRINGNLNGDVVIPGGLITSFIRGETTNADFRLGDANGATSNFTFNRVNNSSISTESSIGTLRAVDWRNSGAGRNTIRTPSLTTLITTGHRPSGVDGDFWAGLDIIGSSAINDLGAARISGGIFSTDWNVSGNSGPIRANGDVNGLSVTVTGQLSSFIAKRVSATDVRAGNDLSIVRAIDWFGGSIAGRDIRSIVTTGLARDGVAGDFQADVTANPGNMRFSLSVLQVNGNLENSSIEVNGELNRMTVRGDVDDVAMDFDNQVRVIMLGSVSNTDIRGTGTFNTINVSRWLGGTIEGRDLNRLITRGGQGIDGDFIADANLRVVNRVHIGDNGDLESTFLALRIQDFSIAGDMRFSFIRVNTAPNPVAFAIGSLRVGGMMDVSEVRSAGNVDFITVAGMNNSGVYLGAPSTQYGLPDSGQGLRGDTNLNRVVVRGLGGRTDSMIDSFIVGARLGTVELAFPQSENFGRPFGVAAGSIGEVSVRMIGATIAEIEPSATLDPVDDFQVRLAFRPPASA